MMEATDSTDVERAPSSFLTLDNPIIPFPDLDQSASPSESLTRCTSAQSPSETVASTPASASFPSVPFPSAAPSTTTAYSTPLLSPLSLGGGGGGGTGRQKEPRESLGRRLKIRSGGNLQVHDLKLRQYTDYDSRTGTPRSPFFSPAIWSGNTFGERELSIPYAAADQPTSFGSCLSGLDEYAATDEVGPLSGSPLTGPTLPILDVYATKTVTSALNEPGVMARMRHFSESCGRARDIDFLLKVEEYATAVKTVETLLADASLKLTAIASSTATSNASIHLPLKTTRSLATDTRDATLGMLPRLDGVFDDAKVIVEQSLTQDIYPGFLESQLSLSLQSVGPGYSPNQVCPGFGEAFCMTDPHDPDSPMAYASVGLAGLTGYSMRDLLNRNCRFLQGPDTRPSTIDRIRTSLANNKEFSELVLNFKKDGRAFWNLIFVAPLIGLGGEVLYQLGGQIDVTEMLETQEDVACVLSYVPPLMDGSSAPHATSEDDSNGDGTPTSPQTPRRMEPNSRHSSALFSRGRRHRGDTGGGERGDASFNKYPPSASRNKFFRSFLRRYSSASSYNSSSNATLNDTDLPNSPPVTGQLEALSSISAPAVPMYDSRKSLNIPSGPPAHSFAHQVVLSPYSRFIVMDYVPPPSSSGNGNGNAPTENNNNHYNYKKSGSRNLQLPVAFCSPAALECLQGNNSSSSSARTIADVVGLSIFEVLSDKANSPSVTKSFKSTVRASLAEGRSAKLDITLNGSAGGRARAVTRCSSLSRRNNSGNGLLSVPSPGGSNNNGGSSAEGVPPTSSQGRSIRTSMSLERLVSRRNSADCSADYVSYWTPLKDNLGITQYVVMIFVAEVS